MSATTAEIETRRQPQRPAVAEVASHPWWRSVFAIAAIGSVLLWAALPPLAWGWLGWIAPVPWLHIVRRERLAGRRPYLQLYFAGLLFWLLTLHWLRLPHPATYLGWLALAGYLACYLPVFVVLSRVGVHRLHVPLWLVAPIVWTGLELAQGHLLTGFLMGSLGHTQAQFTLLIQIADLVGAYGVSFLVMFIAASMTTLIVRRGGWQLTSGGALHAAVVGVMLCFVISYGFFRQHEYDDLVSDAEKQGPTVALIQGNTLPTWKVEPGRQRRIMEDHLRLSRRAVEEASRQGLPLDVIIWPETMFRTALLLKDGEYRRPANAPYYLDQVARLLDAPLLVGLDRIHIRQGESGASEAFDAYNSAALVNRAGELVATYDKSHLVMFGEYIPFATWVPWLYELTPIAGGAMHGAGPVAFDLDGVRYVPSICYETVIPHVIRRQVRELTSEKK